MKNRIPIFVTSDKQQTMPLTCLLIDDSETQRVALEKVLDRNLNVLIVGSYGSPREARNFLKNTPVDLIFLDIEMPELSGFELLDLLPHPPMVILVSAYTHHALKAFDYDVVDFLQKPVKADRVNQAIQRAMDRTVPGGDASKESTLIKIKTNQKRYTRIPANDILYVEALGDYIRIVTTDAKHVILNTLKAFIEELPEGQFLRVHKSFIVNLDRIANYGTNVIELDGHEIPLSRRRKTALDQALAQREEV